MISLSVSFLPHPSFYVHSFPSTQCSQIIRFFPTGWKTSDKLIHTEGFNGLPFPKVVAIQEELKLGIWKDEALAVVSEPPGSSTQILHSPPESTWLWFGEIKETLVEPSGDLQPFLPPVLFCSVPSYIDWIFVVLEQRVSLPLIPGPPRISGLLKMSPCLDVASSASELSLTLPFSPQI